MKTTIKAAVLASSLLMAGAALATSSHYGNGGSMSGSPGQNGNPNSGGPNGGGIPGCQPSGNQPKKCGDDGGSVPGVPEPGTWAMLIVGAGLVGYQVRRRALAARS